MNKDATNCAHILLEFVLELDSAALAVEKVDDDQKLDHFLNHEDIDNPENKETVKQKLTKMKTVRHENPVCNLKPYFDVLKCFKSLVKCLNLQIS